MSTLILNPQPIHTDYQGQFQQLQALQDQWLQQQQLLQQQLLRNQESPDSEASDDAADSGSAAKSSDVQSAGQESDAGVVQGANESSQANDDSATTQGAQLLAMFEFMAMMVLQQLMKNLQAQQGNSGGSAAPSSDAPEQPEKAFSEAKPEAAHPGSDEAPAAAQPEADAAASPPQAAAAPESTPQQPIPAPPPPEPQAAPASKASPEATPVGGSAAVNGGGPNSLNLVNNTDKAMPVAFFRNLAPGEHPSFDGPEAKFEIPPHSSLNVSMPEDWQGRVQKWSGNTQDPSNWAEINFEKATHKIWFDESDIPGRNSSMTIEAPDGAKGGSDKSVLGNAPDDVKTTDSAGNQVIKPPQWFDGKTNQQSVDFLNKALGNTNAYVLPDDNNAVRTSNANSLKISFGEA